MRAFPIPIPIRCAAPDLAARLRAILWGLAKAIAIAFYRSPLIGLAGPITHFLTTTIKRFNALAAHVNDGVLPRKRTNKPTGQRTGRAPNPRPTKFGWLLDNGGADRHHINYWRKQLETLVNEPTFGHFLAAAPTAGRLLRPICHLLALKPALLYPPKPNPAPKPQPIPEPPAAAEVPPDPPPPRVWTIDDLPCPRLATRWPFRDVLGKIRT